MSRLQETYNKTIVPALQKELGFASVERVPRIEKIVLNVGSGEIQTNKAYTETLSADLSRITGQKPVITHAKKAISAFKIREGNAIGMIVTLRGKRMYDFLDKLINITAPRVRDFRGFPIKSFDGHGNYSLGFKEQTVFTEIPYDSINRVHGVQITIRTTAKTDDEGKALLKAFSFPFTKEPQQGS